LESPKSGEGESQKKSDTSKDDDEEFQREIEKLEHELAEVNADLVKNTEKPESPQKEAKDNVPAQKQEVAKPQKALI